MLTIYFINTKTTNTIHQQYIINYCYNQFLNLEKKYASKSIKFKTIKLGMSIYAYSNFLRSIWSKSTFILIERDMFIKKTDLEQMIKCKYKLICSAQYKVSKFVEHQQFTGCNRNINNYHFVQINNHTKIRVTNKEIDNSPSFYDYGCFGFCRIPLLVQKHIKIPKNKWNNLDTIFYELYIKFYGVLKVHNHKYISHLHIY